MVIDKSNVGLSKQNIYAHKQNGIDQLSMFSYTSLNVVNQDSREPFSLSRQQDPVRRRRVTVARAFAFALHLRFHRLSRFCDAMHPQLEHVFHRTVRARLAEKVVETRGRTLIHRSLI
jgi:hypothetical protein